MKKIKVNNFLSILRKTLAFWKSSAEIANYNFELSAVGYSPLLDVIYLQLFSRCKSIPGIRDYEKETKGGRKNKNVFLLVVA